MNKQGLITRYQRFLLMIAFLLSYIFCNAYDFEVDGIYYNENLDGTVSVTFKDTNNNSYHGNVIIPNTVTYNGRTYPVTSIGKGAFYKCTNLTHVDMPNSITAIDMLAFYSCSNLFSVTIPSSVLSIGDMAFYYCSNLTDISIPNTVFSIGGAAFGDTEWLDNQPEGLVYAGLVAYDYKGTMPSSTHITLREGTRGIAASAFYNCTGLTSISIPNTVLCIGVDAFCDCSSLTGVTIPNSVISIGTGAFIGCSGLIHASIPSSVTYIGDNPFMRCTKLIDITVASNNSFL